MNLSRLTKFFSILLAVGSLFAFNLNTYAQTTTPVATPNLYFDITSCGRMWKWEKRNPNDPNERAGYIDDLKAGIDTRTKDYWEDRNCVSHRNFNPVNGAKYSDFPVKNATSSEFFNNRIPVLGIYPNSGFAAQNLSNFNQQGQAVQSVPSVDRSKIESLTGIFDQNQLRNIFGSTNGAFTTGMPKYFSTGPDVYEYYKAKDKTTGGYVYFGTCFSTNASGQSFFDANKCTKEVQSNSTQACFTNGSYDRTKCGRTYRGGLCVAQNGQITARTSRAGEAFNPSLYGYNVNDVNTMCAPTTSNGTRLASVQNRPLYVYQYVFRYVYPNQSQCALIMPGSTFAQCTAFYQNRFGLELGGNTNMSSGTELVSTSTFYGAYSEDSRWFGYVQPDVGRDPKKNLTNSFFQTRAGFSSYEI